MKTKLYNVEFVNCKLPANSNLKRTQHHIVEASETATDAEILAEAKQKFGFLLSTGTAVRLV